MTAEQVDRLAVTSYVLHVSGPIPNDLEAKVSLAHMEAILNQSPGSEGSAITEGSTEAVDCWERREGSNGY